jgi:type IV secretion system protein VirB6
VSSITNDAIAFLLEHVDKVGANLVARTYQNLVSHYSATIFTLTAIYIGFIFIQMQRGNYDANDFVVLIIRTVVILTLALNYSYFCIYIYDIFTNEPLKICQSITISGGVVEPTSISHSLDHFMNSGRNAAIHIMSMGAWSNPTYYLFGGLVFILVLVTAAIAAGLIVLSKCAMTILLALSPLFIFFALFDSTKPMFESFIRQLITYALIPIMTCAVLMILLSVTDIATNELNTSANPTFALLIPLCLMCVIQIYLLLQVKSKCSALSGGFTLPTVVSSLRQAKAEMGSVGRGLSGMAGAAKRGAGSVASASRSATQAMRQRIGRFNPE